MAVTQMAAGLFHLSCRLGDCLLCFSKQNNTALAVLPANAMDLQHSPEPWHRSALLQKTSTCPASICYPQPDRCCVSGRALPSCLFPPEKRRSFSRLSFLCEVNGQRGMDAVLWLTGIVTLQCCVPSDVFPPTFGDVSIVWALLGKVGACLKIALSCLTQVERCPFRRRVC